MAQPNWLNEYKKPFMIGRSELMMWAIIFCLHGSCVRFNSGRYTTRKHVYRYAETCDLVMVGEWKLQKNKVSGIYVSLIITRKLTFFFYNGIT